MSCTCTGTCTMFQYFKKMKNASNVKVPLTPPLRFYVDFCKTNARVVVHLNENNKMLFEGIMVGFDEYMNLVLEDAYEVFIKTGNSIPLGKILLRGESVAYIYEKPETKYVVAE